MANGTFKRRHFILSDVTKSMSFRSPRGGGGGGTKVPARDRAQHGPALKSQLDALKPELDAAREQQKEAGLDEGLGLQIEFESFPDVELAFESLANQPAGIELFNVRHSENKTYATVFVPDGKLDHFEKLIGDYLAGKRDKNGKPRDNRKLIDAISQIRVATLKALWTDDEAVFPESNDSIWWEVWLPVRRDRAAVVEAFRRVASEMGFEVTTRQLDFPERTVVLVRATAEQLGSSMMILNSIAELRGSKDIGELLGGLHPHEEVEWIEELLSRTRFAVPEDDPPHVCVIDTGINHGHPLLAPVLSDEDRHAVDPAAGKDDADGHGTSMAGLAVYGDLVAALATVDPIHVDHRLESVKLLTRSGDNRGDDRLHGDLTREAVARPEITAPNRRRVYSMAVTTVDGRDQGRPSSWSAALDELAAGAGDDSTGRLLLVSAGNLAMPEWSAYPDSNRRHSIHDPAQSWNALTIGACTELCTITEEDAPGYRPVAAAGGLSPFSSSSADWDAFLPLKPDILMEGGNAANDGLGAVSMHSLSPMTTHHQPTTRLLTTANATSAATALAGRMVGQLMAAYPELRPATIRALMIHAASWTDAMKAMFLPTGIPTKAQYVDLVRQCGFGVPELGRALWTVGNSLTLIVEQSLTPFKIERSGEPTLREMHLHRLPWPRTALEALGETPVEMRVTLSYFIEPNPSERGLRSKYRYASHGLRFDVKRAYESEEAFAARLNAAARNEEEGRSGPGAGDTKWLIGVDGRHRGSLHSDIWQGSAADLASRGAVAVYPTAGWWKTRRALRRVNSTAPYSLVVSIHAPEVDVDLCAAVETQIFIDTLV